MLEGAEKSELEGPGPGPDHYGALPEDHSAIPEHHDEVGIQQVVSTPMAPTPRQGDCSSKQGSWIWMVEFV